MKSHKEQSLLIGQNNSVTSLRALSIIEMERMRINELVDGLFSQIGLKRNEKYKLIELIKAAQNKNIEIVSVCNTMFPPHFNPDVREIVTTDFKKRFFGSVLYDNKGDGASFIDIIEMLDDEYMLSTIDAMTVNDFSNTKMVLYIKGNLVDEDNTVRDPNDIVMTISFSN
jgi:hypothetical protein